MSEEPTPPPPVRQRNTTPYVFNVAETKDHPAYAVQPGETAELPALLDGWTPVEDETEPTADETPAKTPSRKRAAAADTDKEGGEPQ
ncbi:hypothetical protein ACWCRD_03050 [Streptomyces sp. NPDC002092]